MIRVPEKISPYVDFDNGKIIAINLPKELEEDFEKFKKVFEELKNDLLTDW